MIIGRKFRTLTEIYEALPSIDCVGRCAAACTIIPMSNVERQRVATKGFRIPLVDVSRTNPDRRLLPDELQNTKCPALTEDNRCAVHPVRPLICRMYGVVEDLRCPFGCVVTGDMLTVEEGHHLLDEARRIGGGSTVIQRRRKENSKKSQKHR